MLQLDVLACLMCACSPAFIDLAARNACAISMSDYLMPFWSYLLVAFIDALLPTSVSVSLLRF